MAISVTVVFLENASRFVAMDVSMEYVPHLRLARAILAILGMMLANVLSLVQLVSIVVNNVM